MFKRTPKINHSHNTSHRYHFVGLTMYNAYMHDAILAQTSSSVRKPLRIALVTETYIPEINGVSITIAQQVSALQQFGHEIQLIRPQQNSQDQPSHTPRFEQVLTRGIGLPHYPNLKIGLPEKRTLLRLWALNRPDIVHIVTEGPLGWSALSAARALCLPISSDFHTNFHHYTEHYGLAWLRKAVQSYLRYFHNRGSVTVVPTESLQQELQAKDYEHVKVVPRGVDVNLFHPSKRDDNLRASWGVHSTQQVVMHVGRIAAEKNLVLLFQAFAAMQTINPSLRLVIVGDGPERQQLKNQHPDVIFCGMREKEDLATHYASGDIFLYPSLTETYGNVTGEAMASGLAVLAYDYAAAKILIQSGHNGYTAEYQQPTQFLNLANDLARNPQRVRDMGLSAYQTIQAYAWEQIHRQFETLLYETQSHYSQQSLNS